MIFVTLFFELIELGLYFCNNSSILSAKLLSEVCKTTEKPLGPLGLHLWAEPTPIIIYCFVQCPHRSFMNFSHKNDMPANICVISYMNPGSVRMHYV